MKKKFCTLLLLLIFFAALGQQVYKLHSVFLQNNFVDFNVYTDAITKAFAHKDIYTIANNATQIIPFNYPPTSLIFFLPVLLFPKAISSLLFLACSLTSLFLTIWLLVTRLYTKSQRLFAFLMFSSVFIQYFPTKFTLTLGQINIVILLFITTSFYLSQKNKDIISGICLGIATLIKIFPGFLILFYWKEKKWKTIASFTATLVVGLLVSIVLFDPTLISSYIGSVGGNLFFKGGEVSYFDQSLNSFLLRLQIDSVIRLCLRILFTTISLILFLRTKKEILSYFGLICSVLIFLPSFAWFHHYVILIPLFIILWKYTHHTAEKLVLICIYALTSFHLRTPELFSGTHILLYSHPFIGVLFLWILISKNMFYRNNSKL